MQFNDKKTWDIPQPSSDFSNKPRKTRVSQTKFYNEYFPSSHRIFDTNYFPDITILNRKGGIDRIHHVSRVSIPIQQMAIDIILAHLLGNKSYIVDGTLSENKTLPIYKEYWEDKNIDTARYEFVKSVLALGDGAILFYRKNGKLMWQILSLFSDDDFHMEYDKYGMPLRFYKYYDTFCDVYDTEYCTTYQLSDTWQETAKIPHGFKGIPVAYSKRNDGAFWTPAQSNIDNLEKMLSRLSEDNRSKFKSLYHLKTHDPKSVKTQSSGMTDMIVTDTDGDFKLISGANMSDQFKFEFETQLEIIFNALGIVFPKHKSSGDMPTGSMKMMFYPTERVVMSLINEFNSAIDHINDIVKQGFIAEYPQYTNDIINSSIRASIKMFTPQDDNSKVDAIVKLKQAGAISSETASEESPYSANNEEVRKANERQAQIIHERQLEDARLPYQFQ